MSAIGVTIHVPSFQPAPALGCFQFLLLYSQGSAQHLEQQPNIWSKHFKTSVDLLQTANVSFVFPVLKEVEAKAKSVD